MRHGPPRPCRHCRPPSPRHPARQRRCSHLFSNSTMRSIAICSASIAALPRWRRGPGASCPTACISCSFRRTMMACAAHARPPGAPALRRHHPGAPPPHRPFLAGAVRCGGHGRGASSCRARLCGTQSRARPPGQTRPRLALVEHACALGPKGRRDHCARAGPGSHSRLCRVSCRRRGWRGVRPPACSREHRPAAGRRALHGGAGTIDQAKVSARQTRAEAEGARTQPGIAYSQCD